MASSSWSFGRSPMPITVAPTSCSARGNSRWFAGKLGSTKMTFIGGRGRRASRVGLLTGREAAVQGDVFRGLVMPREIARHAVHLQLPPGLAVGVRVERLAERPRQTLGREVLEHEPGARARRGIPRLD